jgi:hypothetical protein
MNYDIFITLHNKDFIKLPYLIASIYNNLENFNDIYVVSPGGEKILQDKSITYLKDKDVLNIDQSRLKHRPNWMTQMFLKMFQNVTQDWYFTIDSDCIVNRPFPLFTNSGKPILYRPDANVQQNHAPYFNFQEKVLGLPRKYDSTFITDTNLISKKLIRKMLSDRWFTVESFLEDSYNVIDHSCYPGEPEIWGQYVLAEHFNSFEVRTMKTAYNARVQSNPGEHIWSKQEYEDEIKRMKTEDLDVFAIHSWWDWNV